MNIYTFNAFRENLSDEIQKLEELLSNEDLGKNRGEKIQVHFCSTATLLRKIIAEVPNYEGKNIRVYESFDKSNSHNIKPSNMSLKRLVGKIIHYETLGVGFVMSLNSPLPPSSMEYVSVISDQEDTGVYHREFLTEDFINVAKEVAENDRKVLKHVLLNAIKNLEYDINQNLADQEYREFNMCGGKTYYPVSFGIKVYNSLMYVSDLIRKIGNYKLPDRNTAVFFEVKEGDRIIQVKECNIEYSHFFQHFGVDLRIDLSDRYLETYQNTRNTKLKGCKTITMYGKSLENFGDGKYSKCIIIAKDLLDLLNQCKK